MVLQICYWKISHLIIFYHNHAPVLATFIFFVHKKDLLFILYENNKSQLEFHHVSELEKFLETFKFENYEFKRMQKTASIHEDHMIKQPRSKMLNFVHCIINVNIIIICLEVSSSSHQIKFEII